MNRLPHIVLLLAGGKGCRMHSDRPKQFLEIEGLPVIAHPLLTLQTHKDIDKIYVVCAPEWNDYVCRVVKDIHIGKFVRTIPAGVTGIDSIRNGMEGIRKDTPDGNPIVMLHEAVRPLLSAETVSRNLEVFHAHGNAITAIRSNEAYMVSKDGIGATENIPREILYRAQTPQTFFLKDIEEAFAHATRNRKPASQSLYTLMAENHKKSPLFIAPGCELNFKITLPEDIDTLKAILSFRNNRSTD